ncbi:hypothetical protein Cflav_PD5098 [Pedosphaera parvula Ellin514]|uniref:Uncharacterized protein n=1 Tax=Pedosphaera parvula (strain Ellin514) TaxID=320771 RepID=B9XBZ5_PEDPL|nr:hypothetical protein Cflav_PD5098 [Pedosphaera parvula Ellin514]
MNAVAKRVVTIKNMDAHRAEIEHLGFITSGIIR